MYSSERLIPPLKAVWPSMHKILRWSRWFITKLKNGGTAVSDSEAAYIVGLVQELSDDAELGREYRKTLVKDLVKLCGRELPQLDINVFKRLAGIMTAKELVTFKEAFEKQRAEREKPAPQLARQKEQGARGALSEFRI